MLTQTNSNPSTTRNSRPRRTHLPNNWNLKIISANVRGFRTNIGELAHNFVLKNNADIVFLTETKLDNNIPVTYGRIPGYSVWSRRDRVGSGGGVALSYRNGTRIQIIEEDIPDDLEMILYIISVRDSVCASVCVCVCV